MPAQASKRLMAQRRAHRIRSVVTGTPERPRLSVHISNYHVTAQVIDDSSGKTIVYATTVGNKTLGGNMTDKAQAIGAEIAAKASKAKLKEVVFDRGSRLYHGRLAALADAARQNGLRF